MLAVCYNLKQSSQEQLCRIKSSTSKGSLVFNIKKKRVKLIKKLFTTTSVPSSRKQPMQPLPVSLLSRPQHWDRLCCKKYDVHHWFILSSLNSGYISVLLLLDLSLVSLSADFDTTDHQILLSLWTRGIQLTELRCTSVSNLQSPPSQLTYGGAQCWGLFYSFCILHMSVMSIIIIATYSVNCLLFADVTELQKTTICSEMNNLTKVLKACTDDIRT